MCIMRWQIVWRSMLLDKTIDGTSTRRALAFVCESIGCSTLAGCIVPLHLPNLPCRPLTTLNSRTNAGVRLIINYVLRCGRMWVQVCLLHLTPFDDHLEIAGAEPSPPQTYITQGAQPFLLCSPLSDTK